MATIPTVYYQVTNDVYGERTTDARSIGILDPNRTMLNLQSALSSATDKTDTYRFRMMKDGPIGVSISATDKDGNTVDAKIEVLNRAGQPIADNTATSGKLKDGWDKMNSTSYDGKKGDYYVRVTRAPGESASQVLKYNVQVRSTFTYRDDYTTIEKPASASSVSASYGMSATASTLASQMKTSLDGVTKESDSQKLLSSLVSMYA